MAIAEAARAAVGEQQNDDYLLRPQEHAAALKLPEANALREVLTSAPITEVLGRYSAADSAAIKAQSRYKRGIKAAIVLRVAAIVIGAWFFLPLGEITVGDVWPWAAQFTGEAALSVPVFLLQGVLLAASWIIGQTVFRLGWYQTWKEQRGEAEAARVELFNRVLAAGIVTPPKAGGDGELPLLPLAFEYFRRYQMQVQRSYYRNRTRQSAKALSWKRMGKWAGGALAFTLTLHLLYDPDWLTRNFTATTAATLWFSSGAAGVFGSMFATVLTGLRLGADIYSQMMLDRRNAVAYDRLAKLLDKALQDNEPVLAEIRSSAVEGQGETVARFVENLQRHMMNEHTEWKSLRDHMLHPHELMRAYVDPVRTGLPV